MIRAMLHFPQGFLWGSATSSHQVEGGNSANDWWAWEHEPDRILHGHQSGEACQWWAGRWEEDLDRAVDGHQNAHRLSIEWSRIEPHPALWDEEAIDAYRTILQGMRSRGLTPMVTLHHFTNPLWLAEQGGWANPKVIGWFERFTRKVVGALQDLVELWITINEPNVYIYSAYVEGVFPPGERDLRLAWKVARNMVRAHAAACGAIHELSAAARVGVAHHFRDFSPLRPGNPLDHGLAAFRHSTFNELFPRALREGRLRFLHWREQVPEARGTQDFFGLNYYTRERVGLDPWRPGDILRPGDYPEQADVSPTGFIANEPEGFWEALRWAHRQDLPIYITENGVEDPSDQIRSRYLVCHLRELWKAANYNWRIWGYFHWSLVDNFEWERGWTQRFGLWGLERETQRRVKRPAADLYAEICQANGLSSESVSRYAPEILEALFPPGPPTILE